MIKAIEEKQKLTKEQQTVEIFRDIRERFDKWRFNMYLCAFLYIIIFVFARKLNYLAIRRNSIKWSDHSEKTMIIVTSIVLGACFIADGIITSYLKTPLQRPAIKTENSPVEDKEKGNLMREAQAINELFKETFKKFGILVIPALLVNVIDQGGQIVVNESGKVINQGKKTARVTYFTFVT